MSCTGGTRRWPLSNPTHCHHTQPFCSFWLVCNTAASSYRKLLEHKQQSLPFCTHSDIIRAKLGESRHVLASPSTSKHLPAHGSISPACSSFTSVHFSSFLPIPTPSFHGNSQILGGKALSTPNHKSSVSFRPGTGSWGRPWGFSLPPTTPWG